MKSILALLLLLLLVSLLPAGCGQDEQAGTVLAQPADSKESFGIVAPFRMTERSGRTITHAELKGHACAFAFVYTQCTGPCPSVTATMKKLSEMLENPAIRLVSVSVDPDNDTPEALREYAQAFAADAERWWFLTGEVQSTDAWIRSSFLSPVERDPGAEPGERVSHRTQIVTVDKAGLVRGFYAGETSDDLERIVARLEFLQSE
jgi:cytochrome oxidase Cu insertion factor (SCO1/SenC/PrrC family)